MLWFAFNNSFSIFFLSDLTVAGIVLLGELNSATFSNVLHCLFATCSLWILCSFHNFCHWAFLNVSKSDSSDLDKRFRSLNIEPVVFVVILLHLLLQVVKLHNVNKMYLLNYFFAAKKCTYCLSLILIVRLVSLLSASRNSSLFLISSSKFICLSLNSSLRTVLTCISFIEQIRLNRYRTSRIFEIHLSSYLENYQ